MKLKTTISENWRSGVTGALLSAGLAFLLWFYPRLGAGLANWSYDLGFIFQPQTTLADVFIVYMDETAIARFGRKPSNWDRAWHAQLLKRMKADGAKLVVFDIYFDNQPQPGDQEFAQAMREYGKAVLGAMRQKNHSPGILVESTLPPKNFLNAARAWGPALVQGDQQSIIRQYYPGNEQTPGLPLVAARIAGLVPPNVRPQDLDSHWLNYYGPANTIPNLSYAAYTNQPHAFFRDKYVFVGGRLATPDLALPIDMYSTPYSRWRGNLFPGVEIMATAFLNLIHHEWLTQLSYEWVGLLAIGCGALFGFLLAIVRPLPAVGLAVLGMVSISIVSILLLWQTRVWWPWLYVVGAEIPLALGWSVLAQTKRLYRQKEVLEKVIESSLTAARAGRNAASPGTALDTPSVTPRPAPDSSAIPIPDHALLRRVGRGAYGEVWLAQNAVGLYRAVKIVRRDEFARDTPYEREFNGIRKFMPITLQHPGLLHLLHVGRNEAAGCFYCIMEPADDEEHGTQIRPDCYSPRTLATVLRKRRTLSPAECVSALLALTSALEYLHQQRLIHRDIKPSNIIFASGVAKLADIGLVTDMAVTGQSVTFLGTEGYIAPEGPGTPAADLYSLGKVMYEAVFGWEPDLFPELPTGLDQHADYALLMEFNRIIGKTCQTDPQRRYRSAAEIHTEMQRLQALLAAR